MANTEARLPENKMGVMPVNKLILNMAWPMIVSMLVQAMYNVVDSIFVSRLSENALTAVSLAFPVQTVLIAMGAGAGVGVNAILSRAMGQKDQKTVDRVAGNAWFIAIANSIVFLIVGLLLSRPFYVSQKANAEIVEYGTQYLSICCCFSVGIYFQLMGEKLLQGTGRTFHSMITQSVGAITNIILDPIMIFGLFGCPAMGVAGAAWATVIGQILGGVLAIIMNVKYNKDINFKLKYIKPRWGIIKRIYQVGLPSIIMQSIGSVMTYSMNLILIGFTETAAAVFGVYFKIQSLFFMPVLGLNNGLIPIIAYNYGAGKRKRIVKTVKLGIVYASCITLLALTVFQLLPDQLLLMFDASENMLSIGRVALRVCSISYLFAGFCIATGAVFQAMGNGIYSMIVSFMRQIVVLIPVAYLLSLTGELAAVWWAFPIAELMSLTVSAILLARIYNKIIKHIPDNA